MTQTIRVYHRTAAADAIARDGFRDGGGGYLTATTWTGVWVSDVPFDENEGATGPHVFEIFLPEAAIAEYEWVEEMKGAREWLVPRCVAQRLPAPVARRRGGRCGHHGLADRSGTEA
ncbi:MAG: hypothetical protein EPN99_02400 [Frankiales bacterium]|nr:MAG: hypothetical protein EPN99_02400 [Frankiales bacterium]